MQNVEEMLAAMQLDRLHDSEVDKKLRKALNKALAIPAAAYTKGKNPEISQNYRHLGENHLKRMMFLEASQYFTLAFTHAVYDSEDAVLACLSRAMALEGMRAFDECLLDVEYILKTTNENKIIDRVTEIRVEVLQEKVAARARQTRSPALSPILEEENPLKLTYGESEEVPGASSAIGIAWNAEYGRHFVALKQIKIGATLLMEESFMSFVRSFDGVSYCHYCYKKSLYLIPCRNCVEAMYCSEECRDTAFLKYHETECKVGGCDIPLYKVVKNFLALTQQGRLLGQLMFYMEEIKHTEDPRVRGFTNNQFISKDPKAILSLSSFQNRKLTKEFSLLSANATKLLSTYTRCLEGYNLHKVNKFIYQLIGIYRWNVVAVIGKCLEHGIGDALYPVFSLLNHSCVSNTLWYTINNNMRILMASRDINPGEQIFTNYLDHEVLLLDAKARRTLLLETKLFICRCEACQAEYAFKKEIKNLQVAPNWRRRLKKNPIDIEAMWEVLKCMNEAIKTPCKEIELMKMSITDAYLNAQNPSLKQLYKKLKII